MRPFSSWKLRNYLWMTKSQCQKPQLQSVLYFLCYDTFFNFFDSIWVFVALKSKCRSWLKIFNSNLFLQTSNVLFKTFHSRHIYLKLDNQLSCIYNFPYWPSTKFCFHHECSFQSLQWQFAWHVLWVEQLTAEAKTDLSAGGFLLMPTCSLYPLRYNIEWGSTSVGRPNLKRFEQILLFAFTAYIVLPIQQLRPGLVVICVSAFPKS